MFQAIAQNTDLKERLCRIHAESMLLDSAANANSSPDFVKVGIDFLSFCKAPCCISPPFSWSLSCPNESSHHIVWPPKQ